MIERMKKISFLLHIKDRSFFLQKLQHLGIVHINTAKDLKKLEILVLKENLAKLQKARNLLSQLSSSQKTTFHQESFGEDLDQLLAKINKVKAEVDELKLQLEKWQKDKEIVEPWGSFDQEKIEALRQAGLSLKYLVISASDWAKIDSSKFVFEVVGSAKKLRIVLAYKTEEPLPQLPGGEIILPSSGLFSINNKIKSLEHEIAQKTKSLLGFSRYIEAIDKAIEESQDRISYSLVNNSFTEQVGGHVLVSTGWFPVKNEAAVRQFFQEQTVIFLIEKPQHGEEPPVKLRNRGLTKLFEPITRIFDIPAYDGLDTTIFLAPFFALFFGMCLADVGYGLIMLVTTLVAVSFVQDQWKSLAKLGIVLSIMTIFGGFLIGDFFGIHFLPHEYSFFYGFQSHEELLGKTWNPDEHKMLFSILLGILQITLAYILRAFVGFRQYGWQGGLKGIGLLLIIDGLVIWGVMSHVGSSLTIGPWKIGQMLLRPPCQPY